MSEVKPDIVVDARRSYCPGPLMELIKTIRKAQPGQVIAIYSSDSGSKRDIPLWVEKAGHELIAVVDREGYTEFIVKKKS